MLCDIQKLLFYLWVNVSVVSYAGWFAVRTMVDTDRKTTGSSSTCVGFLPKKGSHVVCMNCSRHKDEHNSAFISPVSKLSSWITTVLYCRIARRAVRTMLLLLNPNYVVFDDRGLSFICTQHYWRYGWSFHWKSSYTRKTQTCRYVKAFVVDLMQIAHPDKHPSNTICLV
mgnify:CR=1 FL=1